MRFYTEKECQEWLNGRERQLPTKEGSAYRIIGYPSASHMLFGICHWIATNLCYRKPALLWITEWGIWPSSENWQLYYRTRQSYGDSRLLHEAPGHLFLQYETEDLTSMLQVSMLNGWDGYLLTEANYANVFFSHDEFIEFFASEDVGLASVQEWLTEIDYPKDGRQTRGG